MNLKLTLIFFASVSLSVSSVSASAAIFGCNLLKLPAIGQIIEPARDIKEFAFDTAEVPSHKAVDFRGFRLDLNSDGKRIKMELSSTDGKAEATLPSYGDELSLQLAEDATAICITSEATKGATPAEVPLHHY
jgi:hypothetical protein